VNKQKSQQGSGLLAIVIILAVVLIGAVGYIFWQNFMQTKSDEVVDTSSSKTLIISEWNLEGIYDSDITLKYEVKSGETNFGRYGTKTGDYLLLYSNSIGMYGGLESTGANGCDNSIGDIIRTTEPSETTSQDYWHIDGYYYSYVAPQSYCRDGSGEILSNISEVLGSMREFFTSAKTIE